MLVYRCISIGIYLCICDGNMIEGYANFFEIGNDLYENQSLVQESELSTAQALTQHHPDWLL